MMEDEPTKSKTILKPSVIHDDLPAPPHQHHSRDNVVADRQPENPERNYHHDEFKNLTSVHDEVKHADDDEWNGEDA
ncbi:hypothetical protein EZJ43_10050 [Pedobacter changchengzhani]|uniref:Uncharacterized protein n=1 Tax=Pedobacter changchengzhani TaxID=2529274 RepID=A0A4R5MK51_9SPHI|nr:hypothetical protein [Pedobacter changchengzhani]TDG36020.1 hypothetical protein EZJ43_10050 [Pedobacter changchengzhani]